MKEKRQQLWDNLREIYKEKYTNLEIFVNSEEYRLDDLGAIVKRSEYGKETEFGWSIDHVFPISKGGTDSIENLQILHWSNNRKKSDDFPTFSWDTMICGESTSLKNTTLLRPRMTISDKWLKSDLPDVYRQYEHQYAKMELINL